MSPETLHALLAGALTLALMLAGTFLVPYLKVQLAKLTEARRAQVFQLADLAFGVVEELARRSTTDLDDKAVKGLKELELLLATNGAAPLSAGETALAKARFDALHSELKAREALASPQ